MKKENAKNTRKIFSKRIKMLRLKNNLSQQELANKLNITASAIGTYEREIRLPRANRLKKIAKYFSVSSDYLLGKTDNKQTVDDMIITITDNKELYDIFLKIIDKPKYIEMIKIIEKLDEKEIIQIIKIAKTFL